MCERTYLLCIYMHILVVVATATTVGATLAIGKGSKCGWSRSLSLLKIQKWVRIERTTIIGDR